MVPKTAISEGIHIARPLGDSSLFVSLPVWYCRGGLKVLPESYCKGK